MVSLHEPDARPIRKGRLGRPVEFGHKAQVADNDDIVLDYIVEIGNPPDADQIVPAVERIKQRTGRAPDAVTADHGYGIARIEGELADLGVDTVAIPRPGRPPPARLARQAETDFIDSSAGGRGTHQQPETRLRLAAHLPHHHRRGPAPGAGSASSPTT